MIGKGKGILRTFGGLLTLLAASPATAVVVDLTTPGTSGTIDGVLFQQADIPGAGTGNLYDVFLRIQADGVERGYNSDARPVEFDEKVDANTNHSILVSDVPAVTIDGTLYRQFVLDANEVGGSQSLVTLGELQFYRSPTPSPTNYAGSPSNLGTLVWSMDAVEPSRVVIDASIGSGSGNAGVLINVPESLFGVSNEPYLVLFAQFGVTIPSDDGFEEFAILRTDNVPPPTVIPLPAAAQAGLLTLAMVATVGYVKRRRAGTPA